MQSQVGEIYDGKVTGLTAFGAFVKMSNGETGMVHISEVASVYVKDIKDHLAEGQEVKVKVLAVNENNKISLSIKQTLEAPLPNSGEHFNKKPQRSFNSNDNKNRGAYKSAAQPAAAGPLSFEDMMTKFKQDSDEKISALKRSADFKGGARRNGR